MNGNLYEMLAARRPFGGDDVHQLFDEILHRDPRPLRMVERSLPAELERICLKCLMKRASDRYSTAADLAEDLRYWLARDEKPVVKVTESKETKAKIVPKGLRSFGPEDADFFLDLLPGPRDRDNLPESIRFWKTRIEETDAGNTFTVGLIYGPSGCGKSSLVRAGLLPRLASHVVSICIEATPVGTGVRLLKALRRRFPAIPEGASLPEVIESLREGQWLPQGRKVLLVFDQFEQWLHSQELERDPQLEEALRHCDGERVQCLFLVRDDFWLATSRFMKALEIQLVEGHNMTLVDLFDPLHARKVLVKFGQAYGRLPENLGDFTEDQEACLDRAVEGLAEEGRIICVHLALCADMLKAKPWSTATLDQVGGLAGLGATFLEDTFSNATAPVTHRYHRTAAQLVLKALLPESRTDIKGGMRSRDALLTSSAYKKSPEEFDTLIHILDTELRLITPTQPDQALDDPSKATEIGQYYQLAHDYLVPSLRQWLTLEQRKTRKGQAEIRLEERTALWNAKPENRHLPSLWEWLRILLLTQQKQWNTAQAKMMGRAGRVHILRILITVAASLLLAWGSYETYGGFQASHLLGRLLSAKTEEVPDIVGEMASYRPWLDHRLKAAYKKAEAERDPLRRLPLSLALLPVDREQVEYLYGRLLDAEPDEVAVITDALVMHRKEMLSRLWTVVKSSVKGKESQRLRAAAALAKYDNTDSQKWAAVQQAVTNDLVTVPAVYLRTWLDLLRPVRMELLPGLSAVYRDGGRREAERSLATDILADYAADQRKLLGELLMDADEQQFVVIYPIFAEQADDDLSLLTDEVTKELPTDGGEDAKETRAKRQANAAVALLRMNQPAKVWPLLKHSQDPRVRSYIIHWLSPRAADPQLLFERFEKETDLSIKAALLLCLGEFGETQLSSDRRTPWIAKLLDVYREHPNAGLHGAAEWLLRRWGQAEQLAHIDQELQQNEEQFKASQDDKRQWYVNTQGQTFVILDAGEFWMGSPDSDPDHKTNELLHQQRIGRRFAVAAKEVTKEQFLKFSPGFSHTQFHCYPKPDCPIGGVYWYEAAAYCNCLSREELIEEEQWCYEPNEEGKYGPGMRAKENFLELSGYRLLTEAEWEYACRATTRTSRYYGQSEVLLPQYAWYSENSNEVAWPVGSLKPNSFGLFDMLGNSFEWCCDVYGPYLSDGPTEDLPETHALMDSSCVLRGGAFSYIAPYVRSAFRLSSSPRTRNRGNGFRLARTLRAAANTPHDSGNAATESEKSLPDTMTPTEEAEILRSEGYQHTTAKTCIAASRSFKAAVELLEPRLAESSSEETR